MADHYKKWIYVERFQLFRQSVWWRKKDGSWIQVQNMDTSHRQNTYKFVTTKFSAMFAEEYLRGMYIFMPDTPEAAMYFQECVATDPGDLLAGTPLMKAMCDSIDLDVLKAKLHGTKFQFPI